MLERIWDEDPNTDATGAEPKTTGNVQQSATNEASGAGAQASAGASLKIEALKELALTLLREVEALEGPSQTQEKAGRFCLTDEVHRFESDLIRWALARTNGHQRRAARLLGVKVTTLNAKIKRYRILSEMPVINLVDAALENSNGIG